MLNDALLQLILTLDGQTVILSAMRGLIIGNAPATNPGTRSCDPYE